MDVVCGECGATNRSTNDFCVFCSAYLPWGGGDAQPPAAPGRGDAPRPDPGRPDPGRPDLGRPDPGRPDVSGARRTGATLIEPRTDFGTARPPTLPEAQAGPGSNGCPSCRTANDLTRRFCARCGYQLRPSAGPATLLEPAEPQGWWARLWDPEDRAARREYRRALPDRYRWRRAAAALVAVALVTTVLVVTDGHPVTRSVDSWWSVRNRHRLVAVAVVQVRVKPADATTSSQPSALVDSSREAWTTAWPGTTGTGCARAPSSPLVTLTFAPTRIRRLDVYAGLSPSLGDPRTQFRPKTLVVRFDDGPCTVLALADDYANPGLVADSQREVTSMTLGVRDAYPPGTPARTGLLSFGDIELKARPQR